MQELLNLLKDGHSRSVELLAAELNTTTEDILRRMEFLERSGLIRRVLNTGSGCSSTGCAGCSGCALHTKSRKPGKKSACAGCLPEGGFKHMGEMWEVVE